MPNPNPNSSRHVCVCLSHNLQNQKAIDSAHKAAEESGGILDAIYIEEPNYPMLSSRVKRQLREDVQYAQFLGASFRSILSNETYITITEYCRLHEVDLLVIGDPGPIKSARPWFNTLTSRLLENNLDVELLIVPSPVLEAHSKSSIWTRIRQDTLPTDFLKSALIVLLATVLCILFDRTGLDSSAILPIYFLAVLLTSLSTGSWICSILTTFTVSLLYNFLFADPRFTFNSLSTSFSVTFLIMFTVSLATSLLASKLQIQSRQSSQTSYRTQTLFETNKMLQQITDPNELVSALCNQINKLTSRNVIYYEWNGKELSDPQLYKSPYQPAPDPDQLKAEKPAALYAVENKVAAGPGTLYFKDHKTLYIPCYTTEQVYGVVGVYVDADTIDALEVSVIRTSISEGSFLLENMLQNQKIQEAEQNKAIDEIRSGMLRNIGHDIRTPLTVIVGDADQLLSGYLDPKTQQDLTSDIQKNAQELTLLIENLLAASKLDSGTMGISLKPELLSELVEDALETSGVEEKGHTIAVETDDDMLMVNADGTQIVRVLINLLTNCDQYSPKGSPIVIRSRQEGDKAVVEVLDQGKGISEERRKRLFSMFDVTDQESDTNRNAGMGLFLCKKIIDAHNGTIDVKDNEPNGSIFYFTLPVYRFEEQPEPQLVQA